MLTAPQTEHDGPKHRKVSTKLKMITFNCIAWLVNLVKNVNMHCGMRRVAFDDVVHVIRGFVETKSQRCGSRSLTEARLAQSCALAGM